MALDIVFGWHLDGLSYPETISGKKFEMGGLIVGPAGLTNELALRLGVLAPLTPQATRIARYMRALASFDDGHQFFSKSFALDPWSTASCLLVMREQLVFAGWDGESIKNANKKLQTFVAAERLAFPLGSPAENFRSILHFLESDFSKRLPIKSISLVTPEELLPIAWQRLLSCLRAREIDVIQIAPTYSSSTEETDLQRVQSHIRTGKNTSLTNDGTFCLFEADDEYQLSEMASTWLEAESECLEKLVILRGNETSLLDAFCARRSLPRPGGHEKSRWRTALQVLPLLFETCWSPANPYRTLELVALPEGPIPRSLSYHFIQALRVEPGFGGERWANAWKNAEQEIRSNVAKTTDASVESAEDKVKDSLRHLRDWLEPKRFDPELGIPSQEAIALCRKVHKWAANNLRRNGASEMFLKTLNYSSELKSAIEAAGITKITRIQLNRMLDAVAGEGCKPERWHAQSAPWSLVDHPGQIWGAASTLLWWGFCDRSSQFQLSDPWTKTDLEILDTQEIPIERPTLPILREAYSWRQAILNTKDRVILCRSRVASGQQTLIHPLWHEVEELANSARLPIIYQAHEAFANERIVLPGHSLKSTRIETMTPPGAFRFWKAPEGKLIQRKEESYSSLQALLGCPMNWVLRYHAQLHPTVLLQLPDNDVLIGDIAHKVFQYVFEMEIPADRIDETAAARFDELVKSIGLPLLQPGKGVQRTRARRAIVLAVRDFSNLLTKAGLQVAACETSRNAPFQDGTFVGTFDILLNDLNGNPVIVDFKWNRSIKRRIEELESGECIQLASYAWLEHLDTGRSANAAFYMLLQRRLIYSAEENLPIGEKVASIAPSEIWRKTEKTYKSLIGNLSHGTICAKGVSESATVDDNVQDDVNLAPPCKFCLYGNICGVGEGSDD